ncbi:MFS transporter [Anoxybacillus ayderensis]|uniref:MFS transporter n=1 Tax=Anoxybacillus ayderensis TaxID=265546 RepID=UPI000A26FCCA|nr:MFS transporter [Anoxybacillus ayderensis]OSX54652.1 hypothetical protein B7H16_04885 [Anoxybacillus ayderensis]
MDKQIRRIQTHYYLINILYMLSLSIFSAIFYVYLQQKGFTFLEINYFSIVFWAISFLTEIPAGVIADRFGRKHAILLSILFRSFGLFLLFWSPNVVLLVLCAILTAIGESFKSGTLEAWALDKIKVIDPHFESSKFFSIDRIYINLIGLVASFIGAQVLGKMDLGLPFLIAPNLMIFTGIVAYVLLDSDRSVSLSSNDSKKVVLGALLTDLKLGFSYIRESKYLFRLILSLLPLQIVLSGPASQWQLFYNDRSQNLINGYIAIAITFASMIGHYIAPRVISKLKVRTNFLLMTTVFNGLSIILAVIFESLLISVTMFLIHVIAMAAEEVSRYSFLNDEIHSDKRATILSVFNTLESGVTVICFFIIGIISDNLSLNAAWIFSSLTMMCLAIPMFLNLEKYKKLDSKTVQKEIYKLQ